MRVSKTLIIGIGTSGQNVCEGVANHLNSKYGDYKKASWVGIKVLETAHKSEVLEKSDFMGMSVEPSAFADYVSGAQHVGRDFGWNEWGDPNLLKNLGACINDGAGNIRMAGRLALYHNYPLISGKITAEITRLLNLTSAEIQKNLNLSIEDNIDIKEKDNGNLVNVYVVGSLCGGTGSGCCCDLGYLVRVWGFEKVTTTAIFTLPNWSLQFPRLKKNAFVALTELNHYMLPDSVWSQKFPGLGLKEDKRRPYDVVYLTQPANGMTNEVTKNEATIASFLTAVCTETSHDIAAANVDGINVLATNRQLGYLSPTFSSFGIASLEYPGEHVSRMCKERMLQKIYGCWKDNSGKDILQGRNELLEQSPKILIGKLSDKAIIAKYEKRMREEFEKQTLPKDSSIHNKIDTIFANISREIHDDVEINKRADDWIDNFLKNIEDNFSNISKKYLTSLTAGPGLLARILKQTKADIDAWSMPKGDMEKAYNNAKSDLDINKKNIKKKVNDYINIKGFLGIGVKAKQKEALEEVVKDSVAYVRDIINFVAAERVKTFVDAMVYGHNTIQDKYNLFSDKYIKRLENFESAIVAMYKFHEEKYNSELEKVPPLNGKQLYKNNKMSDEVDEIYSMIIKDSNDDPNISIEKREFDMASAVVEKLKEDLVPKLTDSMSSFDSRIMSDIKEYIPDDIKKAIELGANSYFSNLSKYRHIIYLINKEGNSSSNIDAILQNSKPSMASNDSPIPVKFQNDPAIGNINVQKLKYAFCPQQESRLFRKEYIQDIIEQLSKVPLKKPVFDSKDPYRIMYLHTEYGSSLAHIRGIMKSSDSDMQALEDSQSCNDFTYWNTRKDVKWKDCSISKDIIDEIKQFWVVYRFLGHYRDPINLNFLVVDSDGKISPWYKIANGKVFFDIVSQNVVLKTEQVPLDINDAVMDIASKPSRNSAIKETCKNNIRNYTKQVGEQKLIKILFECLESFNLYELNISKEEAENCIINYCFNNGLTKEFIKFKFPEDRPVDAKPFEHLHLYAEEASNGDGYYCQKANGHLLGRVSQETLRSMIDNNFVCPTCGKKYWPPSIG